MTHNIRCCKVISPASCNSPLLWCSKLDASKLLVFHNLALRMWVQTCKILYSNLVISAGQNSLLCLVWLNRLCTAGVRFVKMRAIEVAQAHLAWWALFGASQVITLIWFVVIWVLRSFHVSLTGCMTKINVYPSGNVHSWYYVGYNTWCLLHSNDKTAQRSDMLCGLSEVINRKLTYCTPTQHWKCLPWWPKFVV